MSHPMRKHSHGRQGKRRSHWNVSTPSTSVCTQCGKAVLPHRVCSACGFYRGRAVITIREKTKKKEGNA